MRIDARCRWPVLLAILLSAGCNDRPPNKAITETKTKPGAEPIQTVAGNAELKAVTYADFQAELAKLKGKVVVVDFWAEF